MSDYPGAVSSLQQKTGLRERLSQWILLGGNRLAVAGVLSLGVFLVLYGLIQLQVISVGPNSVASSLFTSGLASGVLTLVTVALSINQLILSRVFGSPNTLRDRLDGSRTLRSQVCELTDETATPNDPAKFLTVIATGLEAHGTALGNSLDDVADPPSNLRSYAADIADYGASIDETVESEAAIVDVLSTVIGTEYARNMTATEYMRNVSEDRLSETAGDHLDAIDTLLEAIAITRQFFKTLSLQQDFARLSRFIAWSGLAALVVTVSLALMYTSSGVMIPVASLPPVVSVGLTLIFVPLSVFIAYILRAATIAHRTVSVGPFIPPEERTDDA